MHTSHRTVELDGPRWLVLLLEGVRPSELTAEDTPRITEVLANGHATQLKPEAGHSVPDSFFEALPITGMRDAGLELDRRSFALRPPWQCDRTVIDSLARRPRGRADAVVLWLRDAGRAAARCGLGTAGHRQALRDLDADVRRALQFLAEDGVEPQVVAAMFAPCEPTRRTFDPAAALRLTLRRRDWRRVSVATETSHARIRTYSMYEVAACTEALGDAPFTNHGRLVDAAELDAHGIPRRPNELVFVPFEGVALGSEHVWAAPRLLEPVGAASLPWPVADEVSIGEVATGFAQRVCRTLRRVEAPADTAAADAIAELPDLLSLLDAETRRELGLTTDER
jgi:hypothetical protein